MNLMNEMVNMMEYQLDYDKSYLAACYILSQEIGILKKLIYRNTNQHGNTSIFQISRMILKEFLQFLTKERFELMNKCIRDCLSYHVDTKITIKEVEKLTIASQLCQLMLNSMSKILQLSLKASTMIQILLSKRSFATYYGLFYGLVSNVYAQTGKIFHRVYLDYHNLRQLLQHYAVVYSKHSDFIERSLRQSELSEKTTHMYQQLKESTTSSSSAQTPQTKTQIKANEYMIEDIAAKDEEKDEKESDLTLVNAVTQVIDDDDDLGELPPLKTTLSLSTSKIQETAKSSSSTRSSAITPKSKTINNNSTPELKIIKAPSSGSTTKKLKRSFNLLDTSSPSENPSNKSKTVSSRSKKQKLTKSDSTDGSDDIDRIFSGLF